MRAWVGDRLCMGGWLGGREQQTVRRRLEQGPQPRLTHGPLAGLCARAGDLGGMTSDKRVTANLKQLIEALSRIVVD